ncbi:bifunctional lysylphosphatidylglycerol flippase/synthetase MprF [Microbacterium enclense]|uniref:bifunctional lysylphosphatidylglycerol flippase/synthetase MprF n=1 Tax=Microbacterium enclense TaxID=993073 RepID=UPI0036D90B4E
MTPTAVVPTVPATPPAAGGTAPVVTGSPTAAWWRRVPWVAVVLTLTVVVVSTVMLVRDTLPWRNAYDLRAVGLALFTVDSWRRLLVNAPVVLLVAAAAERAMGARRVVLAYLGGGLLTSLAGLALSTVERSVLAVLPLNDEPLSGAPPIAAAIGVAMAASCFARPLWRRRVRLAFTLLAVTLFLYSGSADDLYTLISLPVGLLIGRLSGGRGAGLRVLRSSHHETRILLAAVTAISAIGPVIATVWGVGYGLMTVYGYLSYDPLTFVDGQPCSVTSSVVPCPDGEVYAEMQPDAGWIAALPMLLLVVCAWGILRGRRGALSIAIVVQLCAFVGLSLQFLVFSPGTWDAVSQIRSPTIGTSAVQYLIGLGVAALTPLAVALVLFLSRRAVRVASAPGARSVFVGTVVGGGFLVLVVTLLSMLVVSDQFRPWASVRDIVASLPLRLLPPSLLPYDSATFVPVSGWAQATWYLPSVLFWILCIVASIRLVTSGGTVAHSGDRARARGVLERGGGGSLAFMTTWSGNAYWFAPGLDAAIAYRVHGRIALSLGGAFGADRSHPGVGRGFVDYCGEHGWTPVFYSVDDVDRAALADLGWRETQVAEEARLDPRTWTPAGKKRQDVRTATNRAQREGVTAQWTSWSALSFVDRAHVREISEAWVADKTIPEMEFTLGGVDELLDPAVRLMLARDADGRVIAVTSWLPVFSADGVTGYTLDVMRRRDDAMNGVMEFVIGAVVEQAKEEGCATLSLSGSPLAFHRSEHDADRDAVERLLETLSTLLEPAYGFRSLANFKKKFQPEHAGVWMLYPDAAQLPAIGIALVRCYVPGLTLGQAARLGIGLRASSRATRA